jgi:hypothetical protein
LTIPTGRFIENPTQDNLIGIKNVLATLPTILSSQYENGLLPVKLAHGIASLSTYSSARILGMFVGA